MKSLFDLIGKKKISVQDLLGAAAFEGSCLSLNTGEKLGFLLITPVNLNVLSKVNIKSRITKLTTVLETLGTITFCCLNSAQSYDSNKHYLSKLKDQETNDTLRKLDEEDIRFFDRIQITMATSREFVAVFRFSAKESLEHVSEVLRTAYGVFKDNGMIVRQAEETDIKRLLAIYLEQNIFDTDYPDFDGERYVKLLEMKL